MSSRALAAALVLMGAVALPARAQTTVHVRAETRIELAVGRRSGLVRVEGTLRDDLGLPLADREVSIEIRQGGANGPLVAAASMRTDAGGAFVRDLEVAPGEWFAVASFDGDDHLEPHRVGRALSLGRSHVRLAFQIDGGPVLDLDAPEHTLRVHAESEAGGGDLPIRVTSNGRVLAEGVTAADGTLELAVPTSLLGAPSTARWIVQTAGDEHRSDAQSEAAVVLQLDTTLTLSSSVSSLERGGEARLSGELRTSRGPLERKAIGLWSGDVHLGTALTDREGRFVIALGYDALSEVEEPIVARFESDAPWWGESEADPVSIEIVRAAGIPWVPALLSAAIAIAIFLFASARARRSEPVRVRTSIAPPPGVELGQRRRVLADSFDIAGKVLDARSQRPVAGAEVMVEGRAATLDPEGRFALTLPAGAHSLVVRAPGYRDAQHRIAIPHRGEWGQITVRLTSLRDVAWEPLRALAARLASPEIFELWTGRDLESAARARGARPEAIGRLVSHVERACYAEDPPGPELLAAIESDAAAIHAELLERGVGPERARETRAAGRARRA